MAEHEEGSGTLELLSFQIGEQDYSVDIMAVREIRGSATATPLPRAPSYVRGVINLRGTVLPIIDLASRLGIATEDDTDRNVIIVVDFGERSAGLMVDAVSDILAIPHDDLQTPPDMSASEVKSHVCALTIVEGKMIRILDLASVFPPHAEDAA